jgi:hypothetical protein
MGKIALPVHLLNGQRHVCSRNREIYLLSIGFQAVKIRNRIALKIVKPPQ